MENTLSQTPFIQEPPETDWTELADNPVRLKQEIPWLEYEIALAVENGLHATDLTNQRYWLGVRDALMKVVNHPMQQVQEAAQIEAEEAENRRKVEEANARRVPAGGGILRRLNPAYWRR